MVFSFNDASILHKYIIMNTQSFKNHRAKHNIKLTLIQSHISLITSK